MSGSHRDFALGSSPLCKPTTSLSTSSTPSSTLSETPETKTMCDGVKGTQNCEMNELAFKKKMVKKTKPKTKMMDLASQPLLPINVTKLSKRQMVHGWW